NPSSARIIIVLSFILLTILGITVGILLRSLAVPVPDLSFTFLCVLFVICAIIYPSRQKRCKPTCRRKLYWRQKSCDFSFAALTFLMLATIANGPENFFNGAVSNATSVIEPSIFPRDSVYHQYKSMSTFLASMKDANGTP